MISSPDSLLFPDTIAFGFGHADPPQVDLPAEELCLDDEIDFFGSSYCLAKRNK